MRFLLFALLLSTLAIGCSPSFKSKAASEAVEGFLSQRAPPTQDTTTDIITPTPTPGIHLGPYPTPNPLPSPSPVGSPSPSPLPSPSPTPAPTPSPAVTEASWAPVGVPVPAFGITNKAPPFPFNWSNSNTVNEGFRFYFICPTCSGASDSFQFGSPSQPRITLPSFVTGPAVIVLHGEFHNHINFTSNGSAMAPVYVTTFQQNYPARLTARFTLKGSYLTVEHLWFGPANDGDTDFGVDMYEGSHHLVVRHNTFRGNNNRSGGIGIGSWSYNGNAEVTNVVIDDNDIQSIGDVRASSDQDAHCININGSSSQIWITHNQLAYCSGDGVQVEAQDGRSSKIHHIYIGKNHLHHNRQSGAWVKNASDVIISQNKAHDFRSNSGGPGACFGHQYGANYVWYLFNEAHNCNIGINIGGTTSASEFTFVLGNLLHSLNSEFQNNIYLAGAINIRGTKTAYVANNTIYKTDAGVIFINDSGLQQVHFQSNIVSPRTDPALSDVYIKNCTFVPAYNLFSADARFENAEGGDFRLKSDSPARGTGDVSAAYGIFKSRYNIDIFVNFEGAPRSLLNQGAY